MLMITTVLRRFDNRDDRKAAETLESAGITRRWTAYLMRGRMHYVAIGLLLLVGMLCYWLAVHYLHLSHEYAAPLAVLIAAIIGVEEWRCTKSEAALDKFYDRLNVTNERLRFWKDARAFISQRWCIEETFEREMYACLEVDNLEYVIQKYERGFMEPRDALRELTCFTSRCQDGSFHKTVLAVAERGGYKDGTMIALEKMCDVCSHKRCR